MVASTQPLSKPRFNMGRIVTTPGALTVLEQAGEDATSFLSRHSCGDWGSVCPEDGKLNDHAVAHEGDPDCQSRVLSAYTTRLGERLWVITEADRSSTCVLTPEEY